MADKRKNGFYDHKSLKMCFANRFERYNLEINFLSFIWSSIDTYLIPSDTHFSLVLSHNYSPPDLPVLETTYCVPTPVCALIIILENIC